MHRSIGRSTLYSPKLLYRTPMVPTPSRSRSHDRGARWATYSLTSSPETATNRHPPSSAPQLYLKNQRPTRCRPWRVVAVTLPAYLVREERLLHAQRVRRPHLPHPRLDVPRVHLGQRRQRRQPQPVALPLRGQRRLGRRHALLGHPDLLAAQAEVEHGLAHV